MTVILKAAFSLRYIKTIYINLKTKQLGTFDMWTMRIPNQILIATTGINQKLLH